MAYFLGIDGGGTKTRLLLGDQDRVLAEATVGGSNVVRLGRERVRESLAQGVSEVCDRAAIQSKAIAAVCAGLSGAARESVCQEAGAMLASIVPGASIEVVGDMVIAHEAALGGGPGLLVIAGTGSIAYGHNAAGHTARAGGWGFAVSDEGSGHWIGVRAVSAVLQAHDLGEATLLEPAIMEHWDIASHDELVRVANAHAAPDFAGLFPLVVRAFETGDARARQILVSAGMELGAIAEAVVLRLWRTNDAFAVVMSGGVFSRATAVRQAFEVVLRDMCPNIAVNMSQADPALGALSRARRWPNSNSVEPRV